MVISISTTTYKDASLAGDSSYGTRKPPTVIEGFLISEDSFNATLGNERLSW